MWTGAEVCSLWSLTKKNGKRFAWDCILKTYYINANGMNQLKTTSHFPLTSIKLQNLNPISTCLYLELNFFCTPHFCIFFFHTFRHIKCLFTKTICLTLPRLHLTIHKTQILLRSTCVQNFIRKLPYRYSALIFPFALGYQWRVTGLLLRYDI